MKTLICQCLCGLFFLISGTAFAPPGSGSEFPVYEDESVSSIITAEDVIRYADQLDFSDPELLASIAKVESDYQVEVKSHHKGITYYGLMQICLGTARMVGFEGRPKELMDWRTNVEYAGLYLEELLTRYDSVPQAVAAYNAGTVIPCKRCRRGQRVVNQDYVNRVLAVYNDLTLSE